MTFLEALEEAKKGKKVRRDLWSSEVYLVIKMVILKCVILQLLI